MKNLGAYITDVQLLERLDDSIRCFGDAMGSIDANVVKCFNDVQKSLIRQLHYIQMRLLEAEPDSSSEKMWKLRYEMANHILKECQREIAGYHAAGHKLILNMNDSQIPQTSQQLRDIKRKLQDILNSEVVAGI